MDYMLNIELNKELRDAYNCSHFASMQVAEFNRPSGRQRTYKTNASNCVCACLDRIDSLVTHINDLFQEDESEYKICDILSYGQTLIDCISILGKIFNVSFSYRNDHSCFRERGTNNNGNDDDYFKYIRSLCSVHPVETSRHANYQGTESEWSPWISVMRGVSSGVLTLLADDKSKAKKADYAIVVYRNDMEFNKYVYISLNEIFIYLEKRYTAIKEIIRAIKALDIAKANQLKAERISLPEEFGDYDYYLDKLVNELERRGMGDYRWQLNEWRTILNSNFTDSRLNDDLEKYKQVLVKNIALLHDGAQKMDFEYVLNFNVVEYAFAEIPAEYAYCIEKTSYLLPCWEDEDYSVDNVTNEREYSGDKEKLRRMLSDVDSFKKEGADISIINRMIDSAYQTNNSEWARIQIKWFDRFFEYPLDYELSDWYLYLQLLIIPRCIKDSIGGGYSVV